MTPDSRRRKEFLSKRNVTYAPEGVNSGHEFCQGSASAHTRTKGTIIRVNKSGSGIQEGVESGYTGIREQVTPSPHVNRHIKGSKVKDQASDPQVLHEEQCEEISRDSKNDPEVIQRGNEGNVASENESL